MLEWLKTILDVHYTDDIDKKVSAEIGKAFVSRADFNVLNEEKKTLIGQIKERDTQLEELKKVDAVGLQSKITELQSINTTAQQKYEADLKAAKLGFALDTRLIKEGAVNATAVKALLDLSKISLDGDNLVGLDDQLKKLKESERWTFKQDTNPVPGAGGNPPFASLRKQDGAGKPVVDRVTDKMSQLFNN